MDLQTPQTYRAGKTPLHNKKGEKLKGNPCLWIIYGNDNRTPISAAIHTSRHGGMTSTWSIHQAFTEAPKHNDLTTAFNDLLEALFPTPPEQKKTRYQRRQEILFDYFVRKYNIGIESLYQEEDSELADTLGYPVELIREKRQEEAFEKTQEALAAYITEIATYGTQSSNEGDIKAILAICKKRYGTHIHKHPSIIKALKQANYPMPKMRKAEMEELLNSGPSKTPSPTAQPPP